MASVAKSPLSPTNYKTLLKGRQADPFAPMTPGQINQTVGKYTAGYGTPQTDAQIQSSAQGTLDPIIAAVTKNINAKAAAAGQAITGNASSLANSLGGIDFTAPYASAEQGQAAVDAALQQSLNGEGSSGASDLASRLASINDPSVGNAAAALGSRGHAIGTTQLASGSANLGSLLAQAAAAKSYGQKLPGIARLSGLQDVANTNQTALNDIGDASTSLLGQLPGIVQNLRHSNQSLRGDKAAAAANLYSTLTGQNITKATASAGLGLNYEKAAQAAAADNARIGISKQNADTAQTRAQTAAETAAADRAYKQAQLGISEGKLKLAITKEADVAKAKGAHLGLSAKDWNKYNSLALAGARSAHDGTPDGTHPPISWQQFLTIGLGEGIPVGILIAQGKKAYSKAEIKQGLIPGKK